MNRLFSIVATSAIVANVTFAAAQEQPPAQEQLPSPEAIEKMMQELAQPGPEHENFKQLVGDWTTRSTSYMYPAQPEVTSGTATFELIMGGRYLKQTVSGEFGGVPFQGYGITGYDRGRKTYVDSWIDNFGTGILNSTGTYDEKTRTEITNGDIYTPFGQVTMRMVRRHTTDNSFVLTISTIQPNDKEEKVMVIEYTRKATGSK